MYGVYPGRHSVDQGREAVIPTMVYRAYTTRVYLTLPYTRVYFTLPYTQGIPLLLHGCVSLS